MVYKKLSLKQGLDVQEERGLSSETIASAVTFDSVAQLQVAGFSLTSSCCVYDLRRDSGNMVLWPRLTSRLMLMFGIPLLLFGVTSFFRVTGYIHSILWPARICDSLPGLFLSLLAPTEILICQCFET